MEKRKPGKYHTLVCGILNNRILASVLMTANKEDNGQYCLGTCGTPLMNNLKGSMPHLALAFLFNGTWEEQT